MPSNQVPVYTGQSPRIISHFGIPVREDVAFANHKGVEKSGIRKRTEQLLDKLQEPLRKFLEPDEAVFCVARAHLMPGGLEQLFLGWHAMYLTPGVLVLTNKRLLHFLADRHGIWKRSLRCARWGDLEEAKAKGLLGARFTTKYRDGKKETYSGLGGGDAKRIQRLLELFLPAAAGEASPQLSITSVCPDCGTPLTRGVYECARCRRAFKDEKTALQRSWLIPGGGFFYIGNALLGILHALVEVSLSVAVLYGLLVALNVVKPEPDPGEAPMDLAGALTVVVVFGAILALHKWVMSTVARKQVRNYIPLS